MLKLQTLVEPVLSKVKLSYDDKILIMGSCFADNMGKKMENAGFDVCVNPFGTLYNPISLCNSIQRLSVALPYKESDCVLMGAGAGLYCSFSHHSSFANKEKELFLDNANRSLEQASHFYKNCNKVIITLGTSWCYRYNETGETVANCLKRPAQEFTRYRLRLEDVVNVLSLIVKRNEDKQFIFTVSPVRHFKDGAHGNQISKSILLLAVERLCELFPGRVDYFPAYEIVMDELRDYRFYAEDMLHPSEVTISYLWERFMSVTLVPEEKEKLLINEKLYRQSQHRPMH